MTVFPAILTGNSHEAQEQLDLSGGLPDLKTAHIDIIDGQFVDNVTISPADLPELNFGELNCDLHLMTDEPLDFVYEAIELRQGVPIRSVIGQIERMSFQQPFLETVKKHTWLAGLAVDLFTPLEEIDNASWQELDILLVMGIEAGWQGKTFHQGVLDKLQQALEIRRRQGRHFEIILDGGVTAQVAKQVAEIGIEQVVAGSSLWQSQDLQLAFQDLSAVA